ncbi:MAG: glycosyltransferase 87 family protein, partial [Pseudomonadota bacterium]
MTPDAAATTPAELRFRLIALWVLAALMAVTAVHQVSIVLAAQPLGIDFLPMWTGARAWLDGHREVYDFVAITERQAWALEAHHGLRPFVYPPSGLLLFLPFATLPFWWAYGLWTGATGLLFAGVTASVVPRHRLLTGVLALVLSPCAMVVLIGQSTFLVGAMAALAVIWLK